MEIKDDDDVLAKAYQLTSKDRQESYGSPKINFERAAKIWSVILDKEINSEQVALCMVGLKLSRAVNSIDDDIWVDVAGYSRCGWICSNES